MENEEQYCWARFEAEDNERTLSFRNFSTLNNMIQGSASLHSTTNPSSEEEFIFQFEPPISPIPDTVFYCEEDDEEHLNEYQKRDYLTVLRSNSFSRPSEAVVSKHDLGSIRYSYSSKQSPSPSPSPSLASYHVQKKKKVNITSLTSMSDKSRRMMFMFGPVKFEPEMELNAIKERQGRRRRVPATIFPAPDGVGGTAKKRGNSNRSKMMRSIKGTVHVAAALARSVACIPLSIAAMAHKH